MSPIRVVTDSACDLPDATVDQLGVEVVPLRIRFGADELVDREELTTKQFWERCSTYDGLPETAAPSPGAFRDAFVRVATDGADGVVCVNLSSRLSATIEAARQGAEAAAGSVEVRVVDSQNATMGEGLIVVAAAQCAAVGGTLDEVVAAATDAAATARVYGCIDTLENLRRGGRIGGARALLGSLLSIKPVIQVLDGVVEEESKQRTRSRSLDYLVAKVRDAGPLRRLAVFGADTPDADAVAARLGDLALDGPILRGDIGPVIGTHTGRGAVGVAWIPAGGG